MLQKALFLSFECPYIWPLNLNCSLQLKFFVCHHKDSVDPKQCSKMLDVTLLASISKPFTLPLLLFKYKTSHTRDAMFVSFMVAINLPLVHEYHTSAKVILFFCNEDTSESVVCARTFCLYTRGLNQSLLLQLWMS